MKKQTRPRLSELEQEFINKLRGEGDCGYRPRLYMDEYEALVEFREKEATRQDRMPKILFFDIETAPLLGWVFNVWKTNVRDHQIERDWFMLCFAYRWAGSDETISESVTREEVLNQDDTRITKVLWDVVNEADILVAHNGKRFDTKVMNTRFLLAGLPQPMPYEQVDTLLVARNQFNFSHNSLNALARHFGIESKDSTSFELWANCVKGDQEALDYMEKYCRGDIRILEDVYYKLLSWSVGHPNVALYLEDDVPVCHRCGSRNLTDEQSYKYTSVSKFSVMRCDDCGSLSRERTTVVPLEKRKVLLTRV